MSLLCRLKNLVHKGLLKQKDLDRIVIIPKKQENKIIQMRDATPEERESIDKYVNNISKLTGVSFDNLEKGSCEDIVSRGLFEQVKWERDIAIEQLKELGYALGQKIEPCEDCISRQAVLELAKNECETAVIPYKRFAKSLNGLTSVQPKPKTGHWTIKQHQIPQKNREIPTISYAPSSEPTACKIVYTYTHSLCKSEEYLNKYNYCPNCGLKMQVESEDR